MLKFYTEKQTNKETKTAYQSDNPNQLKITKTVER